MRARWLTRREVLTRAGIPLVAAVGGLEFVEAAAASPTDTLLVGTLTEISGPRQATVASESGQSTTVRVASDAFICHGSSGVATNLKPFVVGEHVVLQGAFEGAQFHATEFQSLYERVDGEVLSEQENEVLLTSAGPLRVPREVRIRNRVRLSPGSRYTANVWVDPNSGDRVAFVIKDV